MRRSASFLFFGITLLWMPSGSDAQGIAWLSEFGVAKNFRMAIPSFPGQEKQAIVGNREGRALLNKVIAAAGGSHKLNTIKAMRVKSTITLKTPGLKMTKEMTEVAPDRIYQRITTTAGDIVMVIAPQGSYRLSAAAKGLLTVPAAQQEDQLNDLKRDIWYVSQHAADPQYSFSYQGTEKVGDLQASILAVQSGGQQWRWYVDPQSGHVVRAEYDGKSSAKHIVDYSEWKAVDGVTLPYHEESTLDGQPGTSEAVVSYELNPEFDPKIFEKPVESAGK